MKRFTKQACRENVVASFFPLKIFIPLYFNVFSTVLHENRLADSLNIIYIYIYIYIYISESWTNQQHNFPVTLSFTRSSDRF